LKSERLSVNTSTLYKALIRFIMTYACPAWEFAAGSHLFKSQLLQSKVLRTISNLPRRMPTRGFHVGLKTPYLDDFITQICRQQAAVTINHANANFRNIDQGEAQHRKYKKAQAWWRSGIRPIKYLDSGHILGQYKSVKHSLLYRIWADRPGVKTDTPYLR
jgi:hypothetical protein